MAGHSKWANIKHKKERADAKKGKIFSRLTKEIISAVKQGGADPDMNPKLRQAIDKAKAANLPNDNIERNIKKATSQDQADFDEVTYELYGHGGVGIVACAMTDNKNRTASDMRIATNKRGGSIASPGSVTFNFDKKGILHIGKGDEDELFLSATEAGAEDFEKTEDGFVIITAPEDLYKVKDAFESATGISCVDASLEMIPKTLVECDEETKKANDDLLAWIEDIDDVDNVYHNMS